MSTPNKLNHLDVREIRRRRLLGAKLKDLSAEYGVTPQVISYHTKELGHRVIKLLAVRSAA